MHNAIAGMIVFAFTVSSFLILPGCTSLGERAQLLVPSLQICGEVFYHRKGERVRIQAECVINGALND